MIKFKTYNEFVNEYFVGGATQTYNRCDDIPEKDVEKFLEDKGIKWDEELVSFNGIIEYRKNGKSGGMYDGMTLCVAMYNPTTNRLFYDAKYNDQMNEGGITNPVNAPIYDEPENEGMDISVEKRDPKEKETIKVIENLLKELYGKALECDCDGHRLKDTLYPKYKGTKIKMNITEEGKFIFDSFGRFPDVVINLKNMKKGNHTKETILKEVKKHISKMDERIQGMPSMSQIASFEE